MATTHALAGVALALLVGTAVPEAGPLALVAGALGGLFPDLDIVAEHRKTLHFPVYYPLAAAVAVAVAAVAPSPATVALALFLGAAALHSVMDALGGGLELRPWDGTSDRAVYDHFNGRWIAPRRWVRYDGAPEDLLLAAGFGLPALFALDGGARAGVVAALAVSAAYVLLRKPLVRAGEWAVRTLPPGVLAYVPETFIEDFR